MKTLTLFLLGLLTSVTAFAGGNSGGGGNGTESEVQHVEEIIKGQLSGLAMTLAETSWDEYHSDFLNPCFVSDASLRAVLSKMLDRPVRMVNGKCEAPLSTAQRAHESELAKALHSPMVTPNTKACTSVVGHQDGYTKNRVGEQICLSAFTMKRYPRHAVERELTALLFHEVAHQFGFDESTADALQTYIVRKYELLNAYKDAVALKKLAQIEYIFNEEVFPLSDKETWVTTDLCFSTGRLVGKLQSSSINWQFMTQQLPTTFRRQFAFGQSDDILEKMTGVCRYPSTFSEKIKREMGRNANYRISKFADLAIILITRSK